MTIIKLNSLIKPSALKVAMGYRNCSKVKLCKEIKELSNRDLFKFLKGYHASLPEEKLKEIMEYLNFPFEFLYKDFPPLHISKGIIK